MRSVCREGAIAGGIFLIIYSGWDFKNITNIAVVAVGVYLANYLRTFLFVGTLSIVAKIMGFKSVQLVVRDLIFSNNDGGWKFSLRKKKVKFKGIIEIIDPEIFCESDVESSYRRNIILRMVIILEEIIMIIISIAIVIITSGSLKIIFYIQAATTAIISLNESIPNCISLMKKLKKSDGDHLIILIVLNLLWINHMDHKSIKFQENYVMSKKHRMKDIDMNDPKNYERVHSSSIMYLMFLAGKIEDGLGYIKEDMEYMISKKEHILKDKVEPVAAWVMHYVIAYLVKTGRDEDAKELYRTLMDKVDHEIGESLTFARRRSEYLLGGKDFLKLHKDDKNFPTVFYRYSNMYEMEKNILEIRSHRISGWEKFISGGRR